MNFGSTKTKLDYIIEIGLKRIDAAVEAEIDKYDDVFLGDPWGQWTDDVLPKEDRPRYELGRVASRENIRRQMAAFRPRNPELMALQGGGLHGIGDQAAPNMAEINQNPLPWTSFEANQ